MPTAIHRHVDAARAGTLARVVARMPSGWAVLGDPQITPGYCLLLPDPVVTDLNALTGAARRQFLDDLARLGDAVLVVTGAERINYEILGNVEPALHAHVIPRFSTEDPVRRTQPVWLHDWTQAPAFDPLANAELRARIAAALGGPTDPMRARIRRLRDLHASGCFVMPNPWDAGSARLLERFGFSALATTSAGCAWSLGRRDNQVSLGEALEHMRAMAASVDIPVSADFEAGFGLDPGAVARHVVAAASTGIAGLSIEDSTGDAAEPLIGFELATARIRAAREALDAIGSGLVLTARSEGFIVGRPDLTETLRRLTAFADAGADCLYAPGLRSLVDIRAVVGAVAPKAVNVLVGSDFTTVAELSAAGVRRISVGGALARSAWTGFLEAAREIAEHGTFTALARAVPFAEINESFDDR